MMTENRKRDMKRKILPLSDDPCLSFDSSSDSIEEKVSVNQVRHMRWVLQCLIEKYETTDGFGRPVDWSEWQRFLSAGYVCGFVCKDLEAGEGSAVFHKLLDTLGGAQYLTIRQLRALFHYIIRSERWGDMGGDRGGNTLWVFLESDAAEAVCKRLSEV
ncbi:hypothetical protein [Sulfitobacter sp. 1A12126]|jgi:hypothetical protein|uniref:hypothetical protein n=1 Tax=Sulfitobacter sp. 1A12126 TaxID=3368591 RepID=UPI003747AE93